MSEPRVALPDCRLKAATKTVRRSAVDSAFCLFELALILQNPLSNFKNDWLEIGLGQGKKFTTFSSLPVRSIFSEVPLAGLQFFCSTYFLQDLFFL
jgi:hypothetical protein